MWSLACQNHQDGFFSKTSHPPPPSHLMYLESILTQIIFFFKHLKLVIRNQKA